CSPSAPPPPHLQPLSLHDALPISRSQRMRRSSPLHEGATIVQTDEGRAGTGSSQGPTRRERSPHEERRTRGPRGRSRSVVARVADRKSTRLNSSHVKISYAVSCLN